MSIAQGYIVYKEQEIKPPSGHMVYLGTRWTFLREYDGHVTLKELVDQLKLSEDSNAYDLKIYDKTSSVEFCITRTIKHDIQN